MLYDLSRAKQKELTTNFGSQEVVIDEETGTMFRNLNYSPGKKTPKWKGVFNLHSDKTKYYLVTFIDPVAEAESIAALMQTVNQRRENLQQYIDATLEKAEGGLTDAELINRLYQVKEYRDLLPTQDEVKAGLIYISNARVRVNLNKYHREFETRGYSIFTNLHIPGMSLEDDETCWYYALLVSVIYGKRWPIELLNKNMKSALGLRESVNVENAKTLAYKLAILAFAAMTEQITKNLIDTRLGNPAETSNNRMNYPKVGKQRIRNYSQFIDINKQVNYVDVAKPVAGEQTEAKFVDYPRPTAEVEALYPAATGYEYPTNDSCQEIKKLYNASLLPPTKMVS